MNDAVTVDAYGKLIEPTTLRIQRVLPGPIERIWAYLTESELRRKWMASGEMEMKVGGTCEFTWRNDELTNPPGKRPPGHSAEHSMKVEITELDPPRKLSITWGSTGGVTFELEPRGSNVLLTVTHHRVTDPTIRLNVSAGWHMHLDVLVARAKGEEPPPFWDSWLRLREEYQRRLSA